LRKPLRYQAALDLPYGGLQRHQAPEHWHWDWPSKVRQIEMVGIQLFGVECEGDWQGLMMTAALGHNARLAPDLGKPLVYLGVDAAVEELAYYELTASASRNVLNGAMP